MALLFPPWITICRGRIIKKGSDYKEHICALTKLQQYPKIACVFFFIKEFHPLTLTRCSLQHNVTTITYSLLNDNLKELLFPFLLYSIL